MSVTSLSGIFPMPSLSFAGSPLAAGDHFTTPGPVVALPDPNQRPRQAVDIERIYLPVAVETIASDPAKPVTSAAINISAFIRGALLWGYSTAAALTPYSVNPQFSAGSFIITEDLVNPLSLDVYEQVEIGFDIAFDQATTTSGSLSAWALGLGYKLQGSTAFVKSPGAAFYSG